MKDGKKRVAVILAAICILLVLLFGLFKNAVIRKVVCSSLESQTGFDVELDGLRYNPLKTTIKLSGFRLKNPEDFGESVAIDIKHLYIDASLMALFSDKVNIQECDLDIDKIYIITKPDGETNIDRLATRLQQNAVLEKEGKIVPPSADGHIAPESEEDGGRDVSAPETLALTDEREITIDRLNIRLGIVIMQSPAVGGREPPPKTYTIDQTFEFTDVDDLDPVTQQMMIAILISAGPELLEGL